MLDRQRDALGIRDQMALSDRAAHRENARDVVQKDQSASVTSTERSVLVRQRSLANQNRDVKGYGYLVLSACIRRQHRLFHVDMVGSTC
jgi:hypothetical protein